MTSVRRWTGSTGCSMSDQGAGLRHEASSRICNRNRSSVPRSSQAACTSGRSTFDVLHARPSFIPASCSWLIDVRVSPSERRIREMRLRESVCPEVPRGDSGVAQPVVPPRSGCDSPRRARRGCSCWRAVRSSAALSFIPGRELLTGGQQSADDDPEESSPGVHAGDLVNVARRLQGDLDGPVAVKFCCHPRQPRRRRGRTCRSERVARGGVEPPTFRFSVGRSYQLSYLAVRRSAGSGAAGSRKHSPSPGPARCPERPPDGRHRANPNRTYRALLRFQACRGRHEARRSVGAQVVSTGSSTSRLSACWSPPRRRPRSCSASRTRTSSAGSTS